MSGLEELLERVKAATGPDREIEARVVCAIFDSPSYESMRREGYSDKDLTDGHPTYTDSIDAALELLAVSLPNWRYDLHSPRMGQAWEVVLMDGASASRRIVVGHAATAPLAILAALLQALTKERTNVQ